MTVFYNASDRKPLVSAISEILGEKAEYLKTPSYSYRIGEFTVTREGNLHFDDATDSEQAEKLIEALAQKGFKAEELDGVSISVPLDKVAVGNLTNLLQAKGSLIKKALGIPNVYINVEDGQVNFPWFDTTPAPEEIEAYGKFIAALCKMSITQKRISAEEKTVDNEKYAFRCFLLRLGFIGPEYKAERKILLKNLTGSAAFKAGAKKEVVSDEISE